MGIVYLAREVVLDRPGALNVLPPELARHPTFRERFLRQARTAARLSYPHIVSIQAVDQAGEFVFFAMASIEGKTLGERSATAFLGAGFAFAIRDSGSKGVLGQR